jgi:hypothetical protein
MIFARRTKTYASAAVADADGVKTSFSTSTDPVTLVPANFNGAAIAAGGVLDLPRALSITLSNTANAFSVSPMVVTGKRGGGTVTESFTPANDDGNVTLYGSQPFDTITSIALPAMGSGSGSITIGVTDICAPAGGTFLGVEVAAAGTLYVQYGEGSGVTDAIVIPDTLIGFVKTIAPTRVLTGTGETTVGVTVYLP